MKQQLPDFSKLPEDEADQLHRFGFGLIALLFILLFLVILYALGEKLDSFNWRTLKRGALSFGLILLSACVAVVLMTALIRGMSSMVPEAFRNVAERYRLKKAHRKVETAIEKKQLLSEERARMTARLQATFLFEKEASRSANAQASREFREALQASVMRSCEIAFEHITRVVRQYEAVVEEIESSDLPRTDKTELLNSLAQQMDIAATDDRNKDAQKMMEGEIWKVRFRKARTMAREKPEAAVRYLQTVRQEARGGALRTKIDRLIETLEAGRKPSV